MISSEVIYFADQANYPYGTKYTSIKKDNNSTILKLQIKFRPDLIVVGSNTPVTLTGHKKRIKLLGYFLP
jgi:glutamate racemase